jgi:3-oxoacyl-[acyl-carrier-protein] synthase-3
MTEPGGGRVLRNAGIRGVGSYVPETVVTNDDLALRMDTSDDWIRPRTGIGARRVASAEMAASDLGLFASEKALASAGISALQVDLIICATSTPDYPGSFPSTASVIQNRLRATNAAAFDLGAVCAGFSYALHVAAQLVKSGAYRYILVVATEVMSKILNWDDRNTAILFGDGAGAVIVGEVDNEGYLDGILGADGSGGRLLVVAAGGSRQPLTGELLESRQNTIYQNGREVYKFAVSIMGDAALGALAKAGVDSSDVNLFIPHQANIRIIEKAAERMGLTMDKVFVNLERYGNTSSASIPLALDEAVLQGRLRRGDIAVFVGFGAGLTWGANVLRWSMA